MTATIRKPKVIECSSEELEKLMELITGVSQDEEDCYECEGDYGVMIESGKALGRFIARLIENYYQMSDDSEEITRKSEIIESLNLDKETALRNPKLKPDSFIGIEIQGIFYGDKNVCKSMTSPDAVPLGKYRGFDADLFFDSFSREYKVKFKGEISHIVTPGSDIYGNFTRMDNALDHVPDRLEKTKAELEKRKATA